MFFIHCQTFESPAAKSLTWEMSQREHCWQGDSHCWKPTGPTSWSRHSRPPEREAALWSSWCPRLPYSGLASFIVRAIVLPSDLFSFNLDHQTQFMFPLSTLSTAPTSKDTLMSLLQEASSTTAVHTAFELYSLLSCCLLTLRTVCQRHFLWAAFTDLPRCECGAPPTRP